MKAVLGLDCKQSVPYECINEFHKLPGGTVTRAQREFRRCERAPMVWVPEFYEKYSPIPSSSALLPERTVLAKNKKKIDFLNSRPEFPFKVFFLSVRWVINRTVVNFSQNG